jgi:phosphoribosylanthranilate isomerase
MSLRRPRVQVAGISTMEDALACEAAGVDAIGFTIGLPGGPHNGLDEVGAAAIIRALPPFVTPVLITYRVTAAEVVPLCRLMGVSQLQLHAPADPAEIARMREAIPGLKVIVAVNVTGPEALDLARDRARHADALILDSYDPASGRHGATGKTHDWSLSARIAAEAPVPVILAGGLTPANVASAIRRVRPWGVDVHTGVERPDGTTDHGLVRAFVAIAHATPVPVRLSEGAPGAAAARTPSPRP